MPITDGGEEAGAGLVDVLLGDLVPAARLPVTVYRQAYLNSVGPLADFNLVSNGTGRTYRMLGAGSPLTRFSFGYGLSYATFSYSNLTATVSKQPLRVQVALTVAVQSVSASVAARHSTVREVVQLYVSVPPMPEVVTPRYSLCAFSTEALRTDGSPTRVAFTLDASAFLTTLTNGTRLVTGGSYTLSVSGHLPDDPAGPSNVVTTQVTV